MSARMFGVAVIVTATGLAVAAQVPARPQTRDAAPAPMVGTATLSGIVLTDGANATPLRRAVVLLTIGGLSMPRSTVSGDDGSFSFDRLPAGHYTLAAQRPAFVNAIYGSTKPGLGPGVPIAVADGQHVTGIALRMTRGAVLTGTVRYQSGTGADGLQVQATEVETVAGERRVTANIGVATTDDRGVFRIFGLAPGAYIVQASVNPVQSLLSRGDSREVTAAEVQWAEQAVAPGRGAPGLAPPPPPPAPPPGQSVTWAPVYYPGTPDGSFATTVPLGPGEEHQGVDLTLTLTPTAQVAGQILDPDGGAPQGATIQLTPEHAESTDILGALINRNPATVRPDGTFSIAGVTPGRYRVLARASPRAPGAAPTAPKDPMAEAMQAAMAMIGGGSGGGGRTLWAEDDVTVDGHDVEALSLRLQPGMTVSGTMAFDRSATPPPADLTKLSVALTTPPTGTSPAELFGGLMGATSGHASADGTFSVTGVAPGTYLMSATTMSGLASLAAAFAPGGAAGMPGRDPWVLKSIVWNGHDLADRPFEVRPGGDLSGVVVTFSDRPTQISGTVRDQTGKPIPSFPLVAFATDRTYWFPGSRRIEQAQLSSDGSYTITGLPAGEYFISAVAELQPTELYDPLFLEQIASTALKITLTDGEKKIQDLKLTVGGA